MSISKLPNGSYKVYLEVMYRGERKRKTKTFKTKREASAWETQTKATFANENWDPRKQMTFPEYFEHWWKKYKGNLADATIEQYENSQRVAEEYFEGVGLKHLTRDNFQSYLKKYGKTHALETAKKRKTHFRAALQDAVYEKLIDTDPSYKTVVYGLVGKEEDTKFLEDYDAWRLEAKLRDLEPSAGRMAILTSFYTGMRIGEVLGLQWEDINWKERTVIVRHSWNNKRKKLKEPKTKSSRRIIDVSPEWFEELIRYRQSPEKRYWDSTRSFVFGAVKKSDRPVTNESVNKALKDILAEIKAGKIITFHGLRHTHASLLIEDDISAQVISERLGHSNVATTLKTYIHQFDKRKDRERAKVLSVFKKRGGKLVGNDESGAESGEVSGSNEAV